MLDIAIGVPLLRRLLGAMVNYELKAIKLHMFKCFDCVSGVYHYDTLILKGMRKSEGILHTDQTPEFPVAIPYISDRPISVNQM